MARLDEVSAVGFEAIVELQGVVDEEALGEAWERLVDLHPILGCVRDGSLWRPDGSSASLRMTPLPDGLRLTMLCNHVAFDGVASRILLGDLREEYESVLDGKPARPTDWSPRTLEAYSDGIDWRRATTAAVRSVSSWWRAPMSTHLDPALISDEPATGHAVLELGPVLETLTPSRRKYHWSVDAVLVGVLEKAWAAVFGAPSAASSWLVARDLRPTLGWTRGIGNLSMAAGVSIPDPTADLIAVIDRAEAALASQSPKMVVEALPLGRWRQAADLTFATMLRRSARLRAYRSVSNVGQLGGSLNRWGGASLNRVWFVGPLAHPPYNSFIATGHGSSTLVSVRTSPTWLTEEHARALEQAALDLI